MGTDVIVVATSSGEIEATRRLFDDHEQRFTRFVATSELSWLNSQPGGRVEVSPQLARLLSRAAEIRALTNGLVDPAVGQSVIDWGYHASFETVAGLTAAPATPQPTAAWSITGRTVARPTGLRFDLGGLAKGWTCDVAVESGRAQLVSAGGDIRSATRDAIAELEDPLQPGSATRVAIGIGALATSSKARRRWAVGDQVAHHIIDPRTGHPAVTPIITASVTARTAIEAEAAAKVVLISGVTGLEWADRQPWIRGALACWDTGAIYATGSMELAA
jgi:thiamine biosynthesis lipoprotein